jgi:hypothetical protein
MSGIGKQFKGSGIARPGISSKHEEFKKGGRAHYAEGSKPEDKSQDDGFTPINPDPIQEAINSLKRFEELSKPKKAKGGPVKWIQSAIKKPGSLRKSLHVKAGQKIPAKKLSSAAKKSGVMGKRARLAQTLKSFKK